MARSNHEGGGRGIRGWVSSPGTLAASLVLILGSYAALSVDVVRTGFGIKGDEATYVSMALSLAHDGDLVFDAGDLERFFRAYQAGPEGIFLKRGVRSTYRFDEAFPFVQRVTRPDSSPDRLYYGKAFISSVFAAPFVRLAGLNGILLFHALLVAFMVWLGTRFVASGAPTGQAAVYTTVFFGASITPLYGIWLTSEMFNVACIFVAYFLWFYRKVAPPSTGRLARVGGVTCDLVAAVLLGLATFSKPVPNGLLLIPPVVDAFWHGDRRSALRIGVVTVMVVVAGFATNGFISGELNYQGGIDRRTFYSGAGGFPFEPGVSFEASGIRRATNAVVVEERLDVAGFASLLGDNTRYFLLGRHFGFVPFFFPGVVAVCLFLGTGARRDGWRWWILGTTLLCAAGLMIYMPYTWSGGGGPPGNRYFLSVYPAIFFLTPMVTTTLPALVSLVGGALFLVQILTNPFVAAKQPYLSVEHGALRWLPVELTMVNDLPIMLDGARSRVRYGRDPQLLLYYLDHSAWLPEAPGIWVTGGERAEVIVRTDHRALRSVAITLRSRVANRVRVELGGDARVVELEAGRPETVILEPEGVYSRRSWAYLLSVEPRDGFVPRLVEPGSGDGRFLGVSVTLDPTPSTSADASRWTP